MTIKKGFTLVELAIVVVIISILATLGIISYNSAQLKSRDAKRKADINSIASALELYKADNKKYPVLPGLLPLPAGCITPKCDLASGVSGSLQQQRWVTLQTAMASYLNPLPTDPKAGTILESLPPMAYYYFDCDKTVGGTCTGTGARTGNYYTLYAGPTETSQSSSDQNCSMVLTFQPDVPAGRYICLKN